MKMKQMHVLAQFAPIQAKFPWGKNIFIKWGFPVAFTSFTFHIAGLAFYVILMNDN